MHPIGFQDTMEVKHGISQIARNMLNHMNVKDVVKFVIRPITHVGQINMLAITGKGISCRINIRDCVINARNCLQLFI